MRFLPRQLLLPLFSAAVLWGATARAQNLDQIGVTLLRAMTTNLDGSGIRVAQPEAPLDAPSGSSIWEVNPANVGPPASLFTYASSNGTAVVYPNTLGTNSSHADGVGDNFYGWASGVATNVAQVDNYEADYFLTTYIEAFNPPGISAAVVNQSFTFGAQPVASQQQLDKDYDNAAAQYKTLFVSAACNADISPTVCPPGTAYNCLSVGAYANGSHYNSIGPTLDNGRCKPDITALSGATSFSTPQVSGAAAVLLQAARRGDGGSDTNSASDPRTIKALLLNGAVKPADWTNSSASPLDARYGAGVVNVFNSYKQLAGGKRGYVVAGGVSLNAAHPPTGATGTVAFLNGWDFNTNSSGNASDGVNHYYFNLSNTTFTAAATLVWNRQQNKTGINNLNLFLYNCANSNLVLCSTSLVDNVEHLCTNNLAPGRYDLQVWKAGGIPNIAVVSAAETYALAWSFASPLLDIAPAGTNAVLAWPAYPAGFRVEAATNLAAPAWNTNALPASVFTNNMNSLILNATNAAQFFRLRSPNF